MEKYWKSKGIAPLILNVGTSEWSALRSLRFNPQK